MTAMETDIDWEKIWDDDYEQYRQTMRSDSDEQVYWSKRAEDFSNSRRTNDFEYGRQVLSSLWSRVLTPESVVMDVGAGPGTFVIPFAKKVKRIDAVEPAFGMVDKIKHNAAREGISNYGIINKTWQDVDIASISSRYDLVISSLVLWVFKDVWQQLRRMELASSGYCCVVNGVGDKGDHGEKLWQQLNRDNGNIWHSTQQYPLIYSLLYSKGRLPNVSIINYASERSVEDKVRHIKLCFERRIHVTQDMEKMIQEYFEAKSRNGMIQEPGQAAVIWWRAHGAENENI